MKSLKFDTGKLAHTKSIVSKALLYAGIVSMSVLYSCSSKNNQSADSDSVSTGSEASSLGTGASYVNLNTASGTSTAIMKDTTEAGGYVYSDTYKPIDEDILFVDVSTNDTLYGPTGLVVNNAIIHENGTWKVDKTKIKRDGNEIKIKSGDDKLKIEDEELKMKTGDSKMKVDDDEAKLKTPDSKTKVEDDETKVKPQ